MQPLDCDLAQQAYEERLHKAEQNLLRRYAHGDAAGPAPVNRANALVKQITGWLSRSSAPGNHRHAPSAHHLISSDSEPRREAISMDIYPGDLARLMYQEQLLQQEREQQLRNLSERRGSALRRADTRTDEPDRAVAAAASPAGHSARAASAHHLSEQHSHENASDAITAGVFVWAAH